MNGLLELLHETKIPEIKKSVLDLFSELKHNESIPLLIEAIKNEKYLHERKDLIACCWQNGLSYNGYLPLFIELVIKEPFAVAFEAFTVVENMYGKIEYDLEAILLEKIEKSIPEVEERKQYLLRGLLEIIPNIPLDQDPVDF